MLVTTLLFLVRDDEILLAMKKRGFGVGKWNGVGGKVQPGETIEEALLRECQEEIGVTPAKLEKVAIHLFRMPGKPDNECYTYLARSWQGEPVETEEMAPKWFKQADIPYNEMWADDPLWLPLVLKGKKVRAHFEFDENEVMTSAELTHVKKLG